ncbi:MHYT domain-containing protein [Streptomyces pseudovenezuelae]|uniref:NO-binding membrane sensor protein with MHYT domain n=1 Tax=Streptomyces pseudovenezuelae TaxID=67350 RepID=A0ABT6LDN4_9ACTN|nr:MHYT domain-containing protein [Streptomyces pseudovenezuelae]MDH6214030.1 NO-binding membrane sensor protein with MHYT domain [Streptomyces pseudovenezuelae]
MTATVSNFHYGAVTLVAAYLMACLGAALGLRCTTRSLRRPHRRAGWLALGAVSIGCGIWTMHFIAMIGFSIDGSLVDYDAGLTLLSLIVAIAVVAVGVFLVGYRGDSPLNLGVAGTITGLGVAAMHYLGMAAVHTNGTVHYDTTAVALSVVIAVVAATAALWAAVSIQRLWSSLGASLVMGVAVTGMHYTGMAAVSVTLDGTAGTGQSSTSLLAFLLLMLAGPLAVLLVAAVIVMFDPDMMVAGTDPDRVEPAESDADDMFAPQQPGRHSGPYASR